MNGVTVALSDFALTIGFPRTFHATYMNRIQTMTQRASQAGFASKGAPVSTRRSPISAPSNAFFVPLHYEPNYAYPLIVWLHGPHDNENQLKKVLPLVSMRNYVGVGPRGTAASELDDGSQFRFRWIQGETHVHLAEQRVLDAIDEATRRWNIAPNRTFIAGLQCGGTVALRLALRNPNRFAGAMSFGGPFPTGSAPLAQLHQIRRLPLFLAIMAQTDHYPHDQVCQHLRLFHSAHLRVTINQYLCDSELTTEMLSEMDRWIMDQMTVPSNVVAPVQRDRSLN
jgi:phospholipase/carboxylesterase